MYIMDTKYLSLHKFVELYINYFVLKKKIVAHKNVNQSMESARKKTNDHTHTLEKLLWMPFPNFLTNKLKFFSDRYFRGILINLFSLSLINACL